MKVATQIDYHEEAFLRGELSRAEFVRRKRFRIKVQWEAVNRVFANSALVFRTAGARLRSPGVKIAEKFQEADEIDVAMQIRLRCMTAFAKLAMRYMCPTMPLIPIMYLKRHKR